MSSNGSLKSLFHEETEKSKKDVEEGIGSPNKPYPTYIYIYIFIFLYFFLYFYLFIFVFIFYNR